MAGGVSINMVTKDGGNKWKGSVRYSFANNNLQAVNHLDAAAEAARIGAPSSSATRPRRPTTSISPAAARSCRTACG